MSLAVMRGRNFCRPLCDSPDCGERSVLTDRCNSRACCGLRVRKRASEGGRLTVWEKGSDGKRGKRRNWDGKSVQGDRISKNDRDVRRESPEVTVVSLLMAVLHIYFMLFLSLVDIDIFCKTHENICTKNVLRKDIFPNSPVSPSSWGSSVARRSSSVPESTLQTEEAWGPGPLNTCCSVAFVAA